MAGVAQAILWSLFNPIPIPGGTESSGLIPFMITSGMEGNIGDACIPSVTACTCSKHAQPLWIWDDRGDIAAIGIRSGYTRGHTNSVDAVPGVYCNVSNQTTLYVKHPCDFASALLANALFIGQMLWVNYNPNNDNPAFNYIAQYDAQSQKPTGGLFYYITAPRSFEAVVADPVRALVYVLFLTTIVTIFGRLWVELGGLSAKAAAKNLLDADVQYLVSDGRKVRWNPC